MCAVLPLEVFVMIVLLNIDERTLVYMFSLVYEKK